MPSDFIIIGAGVAGPVAALRLLQDGHRCRIYERTASPQTIGGAVNLAPNGMRLIARLGVADEVRRAGCDVPQMSVLDETGARLGDFPNTSRDGFVGIRIMRSELQRVLLAEVRARGCEVYFGKALAEITERGGDGRVVARFKDGSQAEGEYLIGADGIHSATRAYVAGDITPEFAKQSLVYGILPAEDVPHVDFAAFPPTSGVFARRGFFASAFTDNERTRMYWITAKKKEVAERTEDGDVIRAEELDRFKALYKPIPELIAATNEFFSWPVYELPVLERWHEGRVVLVGDAAHALPPNQGQGVSQAFEDVFVLARVIAHGAGFRRYEELRMPRIAKLRKTIKAQSREHERGPWAQVFITWAFWLFLKVAAVLSLVWEWDNFAYDPDRERI